MNKRIQLLADKIWAEECWTNPNTDKLLPAQLNRFAQLIVEECIEAVRLVPYHSLDIDFDEEVIYQDAIRKHFGVEL